MIPETETNRRPGASISPVLAYGGLQLDPARRTAARDGRRLPLNPKEFAVLELLLTAPGVVMSAEEILERVWDETADPLQPGGEDHRQPPPG